VIDNNLSLGFTSINYRNECNKLMFTVFSAISSIRKDLFLVQITSNIVPRPSGPNRFLEM